MKEETQTKAYVKPVLKIVTVNTERGFCDSGEKLPGGTSGMGAPL